MELGLNFIQYMLSKVGLAKSQPFIDASGEFVTGNFSSLVYGVFYSAIFISILIFIQALGSAKLSYCYNLSIGNSEGVAFLFAILCFIFPSLYYPYYSFFLNAACSPPARGILSGGAKRGGGRK